MMKDKEQVLAVVGAIAKSALKPTEIKVLHYLMRFDAKTVTETNTAMAHALNLAQPNFVRALKALKEKNVVGERGEGIFVRSPSVWKAA